MFIKLLIELNILNISIMNLFSKEIERSSSKKNSEIFWKINDLVFFEFIKSEYEYSTSPAVEREILYNVLINSFWI